MTDEFEALDGAVGPHRRDFLKCLVLGAADERRRPAQQILVEAERSVDVVERDGANDEQGTVSAARVHE